MKNGRRTFESVGDDLQVALQELKARQASLNGPTPVTIIPEKKTLRTEVEAFLAHRAESWRYILGVFGDWFGWDKDPAHFQREDFRAFAVHLTKVKACNKDECLAPRTRKNYLKDLSQFLRSTGRVVIVVRKRAGRDHRKGDGRNSQYTGSDPPRFPQGQQEDQGLLLKIHCGCDVCRL